MSEPEKKNGVTWPAVVLAVALACIAAIPPTMVAWSALTKAEETHDLVNSRMTQMLELVRKSASAEATLKEKATEKARAGAAAEAALEKLPNRVAKDGK